MKSVLSEFVLDRLAAIKSRYFIAEMLRCRNHRELQLKVRDVRSAPNGAAEGDYGY